MAGGVARGRDERGAAAVEFALVLIPLLTILFGIISYGYMLSFRQALSQAAAEGARAAAVQIQPSLRTSEATAAIEEALASYGVDCTGAMSCDVKPVACGTAECVQITLSYDYAAEPLLPELPGLNILMPDTLTYQSSARVS